MVLSDDLLKPIPGENPSGQNVRYTIYDRIQEARREEEGTSLGIWSRELKKADPGLVIKIASDVLSSQSKDLQVAAWLTEAWVVREGLPGLEKGLKLIEALLVNFWETLYPEIEDGDLEMRVGPLEWLAEESGVSSKRLESTVRKIPLTKNRLDWFRYREATQIAREEDVAGDEAKMAARLAAMEEKKCTPEEFDEGVKLSGNAFYESLASYLESTRAAVKALETVCDEKFGRVAPSFKGLNQALDDLQEVVNLYYRPPEDAAAVREDSRTEESFAESGVQQTASRGSQPIAGSTPPLDRQQALRNIFTLARYLQKEAPSDPVGYLILRALRWGELRVSVSEIAPELLEPPPSEVRQLLKKLAMESDWERVLENTENGFACNWSRAWFDLQRHAVRACESLGYDSVAKAICSELRALLSDYPELLSVSLLDDTPVANEETKEWVRSAISPPPTAQSPSAPSVAPHAHARAPVEANGENDTYEAALAMSKQGHVQEAVELLTKEISQERSGRRRFSRKVQLASICLASKYDSIAYPILMELAEEIEDRKLEEWEDASVIANSLALLFRCLNKLGGSDAEKQRIYQKICRLDPLLALTLGK